MACLRPISTETDCFAHYGFDDARDDDDFDGGDYDVWEMWAS